MLRKTLITLTAIAALGVGATGGHAGGVASGGGFGGAGIATMQGGAAGPGSMGPMTRGGPMTTAPMAGGRSWNGRSFSRNNLAWAHDHFHRHNFFVFGVGGPIVVGPDLQAEPEQRTLTQHMTPAGFSLRPSMAGSGFTFVEDLEKQNMLTGRVHPISLPTWRSCQKLIGSALVRELSSEGRFVLSKRPGSIFMTPGTVTTPPLWLGV